jgi:hypothetical protein
VEDNIVKLVGLCQVKDIIPIINNANNILEDNYQSKIPNKINNTISDVVNVPSVDDMQKLINKKGPRKKSYEISNMNSYLLVSSMHNRGMGCGGTSPLVIPILVYLVDKVGNKTGGMFHNLTTAYNKVRELIRDYFDSKEKKNPLIVITPDLNMKILKRQLLSGRTDLEVIVEEMHALYLEDTDCLINS